MIKREELSNPNSCMSRAKDDELTFVLLGRDSAAPVAIRAWAAARVRLGKNRWEDAQIQDALRDATTMEINQFTEQPAGAAQPGDDKQEAGQ